jgi:hypothetical protein
VVACDDERGEDEDSRGLPDRYALLWQEFIGSFTPEQRLDGMQDQISLVSTIYIDLAPLLGCNDF